LSIVSCQESTLVHEYKHTSPDGWDRTDTITFLIPPVTKTGTYEVSLGMRLCNNFPYKEVHITTEFDLEEPLMNKKNAVCVVTSDKDGKLLGYGIAYHQYEQPYMKIMLQKGQHGKVKVYHNMDKEVLPYLTDIGICIDR